MNIVMYVVAVFLMGGEPKTVRLEAPTIQQCIMDTMTVETILERLGAQVSTVFCMIEVTR